MAHKWYAIQTHSGSELSVKRALEKLKDEMDNDLIEEVLVPTEDLIEIKKGKKTIVEKPIYPAYAFARIDLDTALWHRIQSMPKVGRFIGESKKPTPLSDKDIELHLRESSKRAAPKPKVSFMRVKWLESMKVHLQNFNGVVEDFDMASGMLKLNVSIFGRNTPVEISILKLKE